MQSKAKTVTAYLAEMTPERRADIKAVRAVIKKYLPAGYEEGMQYGVITYRVPLRTYPEGYGENPEVPLPFFGLASQKNNMAVYMMCLYGSDGLRDKFLKDYKATGKKLDMGMGCIRFRKPDDLALDVIGKTLAAVPVKKFIAAYEQARLKTKSGQRAAAKRKVAKKK